MKQITIPISEFKAKCLSLIDDVARKGDGIVITKRGKPVAQVSPVERPRTLRGTWKGKVEIVGDIVHLDTSDDWECLKD